MPDMQGLASCLGTVRLVRVRNGGTGLEDPSITGGIRVEHQQRVLMSVELPGDPPSPGCQGDFLGDIWYPEPVTTPEKWMEVMGEDRYDAKAPLSRMQFALHVDEEGRLNDNRRRPVDVGGHQFHGPVLLFGYYEEEESGATYHADITKEMVLSIGERLRVYYDQQKASIKAAEARGACVF